MKSSIVAAVGLGLAVVATAVGQDTPKGAAPAAGNAAAPAELKDLRAKASYGLGLLMGQNLKKQSVDVDPEVLSRGIRDALSGSRPLLAESEIQKVLQEYQQQIVSGMADRNKKAGEAYLTANKAKPGVVTLPSGLQYRVVKEGTGVSPKATDTIRAHYRGTLIDGSEFDSSYKRGQPATFEVGKVIPGWTEALQKMKVGSKWQLAIPAKLAYGAAPPPGSGIGPDSVLLFDVELLGIE